MPNETNSGQHTASEEPLQQLLQRLREMLARLRRQAQVLPEALEPLGILRPVRAEPAGMADEPRASETADFNPAHGKPVADERERSVGAAPASVSGAARADVPGEVPVLRRLAQWHAEEHAHPSGEARPGDGALPGNSGRTCRDHERRLRELADQQQRLRDDFDDHEQEPVVWEF